MTSSPNTRFAIHPGSLIDGLGGPPKQRHALVVSGNSIQWSGPVEQLESPNGPMGGQWPLEILHYPQTTLLPGLIDCHTHTNMPADGRTGEEVIADGDDLRLLRSSHNARIALESGVTTMGDAAPGTTPPSR